VILLLWTLLFDGAERNQGNDIDATILWRRQVFCRTKTREEERDAVASLKWMPCLALLYFPMHFSLCKIVMMCYYSNV